MTGHGRHYGLALGLVITLLAGASLPLGALDLAVGRIRLTLDEQSGRFSLAAQTRGTSGVFVPLLAAQDPRTTTLSIAVGNKVYRMGEAGEFVQTVEKTATGGRFVWKSTFLQVTESFSFTASPDSAVANGVRIDISLKNTSEQDLSVGVRYLFDTYLGESSFVHFRTPSLGQLTHELALGPADNTPWWVSPIAGDADEMGLQVMTAGQGITTPDRVVFANWKRLADSTWDYDVSTVRNFSQLPYSINDSAVSQYYNPRPLPRAGEAVISLVLGIYSKSGFTGNLAAVPGTAGTPEVIPTDATAVRQPTPAVTASAAAPSVPTVKADLSTVDKVLARIGSALDAGAAVTDDELAQIESTLRDLQSRVPGSASGK